MGTERVVVIDDDELNLLLVERSLRGTGFDLSCFSDAAEAQAYLCETGADILIVDQRMPRVEGIDLLEDLGKARPARAYLCSGIELPSAIRARASSLGVVALSKDILAEREQLLSLLSGTSA